MLALRVAMVMGSCCTSSSHCCSFFFWTLISLWICSCLFFSSLMASSCCVSVLSLRWYAISDALVFCSFAFNSTCNMTHCVNKPAYVVREQGSMLYQIVSFGCVVLQCERLNCLIDVGRFFFVGRCSLLMHISHVRCMSIVCVKTCFSCKDMFAKVFL